MDNIRKETNNYILYNIEEEKFKTNTLVFSFKREMSEKSLIYAYLLTALLFATSNKYNTIRKFGMKIKDLYIPRLNASVATSGKYQLFRCSLTFLDEKYTEKAMNKKTINFFLESLFNPNIKDKMFDEKILEIEKNRLIDDIRSIKDSPGRYAYEKVKKIFGQDTNYTISILNKEEDIKSITSKEIYEFYNSIIKEDFLTVFYLGRKNKFLENILNKYFDTNLKDEKRLTHIDPLCVRDSVNKVIEDFPSKQSTLKIGYIYDELTEFENKYVLRIFDFILGGGPDSKLFKEVREKNSLCYSISSGSIQLHRCMMVNVGINAKNYDKAIDLIEKQVRAMQLGDFKDEDIVNAKTVFKSSFKEILDSLFNIINVYSSYEYKSGDLLEDKLLNIEKVTKEDVIALANKLHLDTIYFLKGEDE